MTNPQTGAEIPVHLQIQTETFSERVLRTARSKLRARHEAKRNFNADDLGFGNLVTVSGTVYSFNGYVRNVDEYNGVLVSLIDEFGRTYNHDLRSFELSATRKEGMFTDFKEFVG